MQVDEALVRKIAHLARIKITDKEATALQSEMSGILKWVEQLKEVDTDGVEPMTSAEDVPLKKRVDEVTDGGYAEKIINNAPRNEDNFFMVPKVIE